MDAHRRDHERLFEAQKETLLVLVLSLKCRRVQIGQGTERHNYWIVAVENLVRR